MSQPSKLPQNFAIEIDQIAHESNIHIFHLNRLHTMWLVGPIFSKDILYREGTKSSKDSGTWSGLMPHASRVAFSK